jgi:hypothetical protein
VAKKTSQQDGMVSSDKIVDCFSRLLIICVPVRCLSCTVATLSELLSWFP